MSKARRKKRLDHVTFAPQESDERPVLYCKHCEARCVVALALDVSVFNKKLAAWTRLHEDCTPRGTPATLVRTEVRPVPRIEGDSDV